MMKKQLIAMALLASSVAFPAMAEEAYVGAVTELMNAEVKPWLSDPVVIDAIKAQNTEHASLDQAGIDALDKEWRAEVDGSETKLIDSVLGKPLSAFLKEKQAASGGLITEIFVMDNKGLNVGQSSITSDYWQGDEGKFQKSFGAGPGVLFVDEAEKDESTQQLQAQASMTITDADGNAIGAITVGVNLDDL